MANISTSAGIASIMAEINSKFLKLNMRISNAGIYNIIDIRQQNLISALENERNTNILGLVTLIHQFVLAQQFTKSNACVGKIVMLT